MFKKKNLKKKKEVSALNDYELNVYPSQAPKLSYKLYPCHRQEKSIKIGFLNSNSALKNE